MNGSVYDVTQGRNFYGPGKYTIEFICYKRHHFFFYIYITGSAYANFAGHDASRGLAKNSFDKEMMVDPYGPIDKLEDLEADDWESLREWVNLSSIYFTK